MRPNRSIRTRPRPNICLSASVQRGSPQLKSRKYSRTFANFLFSGNHLRVPVKSQNFPLHGASAQLEPLLPAEHQLRPLLERAHDLQRAAGRLAGFAQPGALTGLRVLLRAMNSYYSNKIEGQHTLPLEIEQALRNDYSADADKARRQRLAVAHMATEERLESIWDQWSMADVWSPTMVCDIHQDLFARLPQPDRVLDEGGVLQLGQLRDRNVSVGVHAAPAHTAIPAMLERWGSFYRDVRRGELQVVALQETTRVVREAL
jgi:Fic family protein